MLHTIVWHTTRSYNTVDSTYAKQESLPSSVLPLVMSWMTEW
jgi:hypothetical protein